MKPLVSGKTTRPQRHLRAPAFLLLAALAYLPASARSQTAAPAVGTDEVSVGITAMRAGNLQTAQQAFDRAVRNNPRSADAWTWKGIAESQANRYAEAVRDLKDAVSLGPDSVPAHYNLALNLLRLHQTEEAIAQLQTVVRLQPGALDPQYNLAVLLEAKNDWAGAADHLTRAHLIAPEDNRLALRLLVDLERAGKHTEAESLLSTIARSGDAGLVKEAVTTLLEAHQFASVEALLRNQNVLPDGPEKSALLARVYIGEADYTKAIALLTQPGTQGNAELVYLLGLAQLGSKQNSAAVRSFSEAMALQPGMAAPHFHLGLLAAEVPGEQQQAIVELAKAHTLESQNPVYALAYARLLLQQDNAGQVRPVLAQAKDFTPQQAAEAQLMTAVALLSSGTSTEAEPLLRQAVSGAGGGMALAHNLLGFCLFREGHYAEAASEYKIASDQQPTRRVFARDAAVAYSHANLDEEALQYASRAAALPDAGAPDFTLKARLESHAAHKQEALQDLQRAVALDPQLDSAYYLLARTYQQLGNHEQAVLWNNKFTALKQSKAEDYAKSKTAAPSTSALLQGSSLNDEDGSAP